MTVSQRMTHLMKYYEFSNETVCKDVKMWIKGKIPQDNYSQLCATILKQCQWFPRIKNLEDMSVEDIFFYGGIWERENKRVQKKINQNSG